MFVHPLSDGKGPPSGRTGRAFKWQHSIDKKQKVMLFASQFCWLIHRVRGSSWSDSCLDFTFRFRCFCSITWFNSLVLLDPVTRLPGSNAAKESEKLSEKSAIQRISAKRFTFAILKLRFGWQLKATISNLRAVRRRDKWSKHQLTIWNSVNFGESEDRQTAEY